VIFEIIVESVITIFSAETKLSSTEVTLVMLVAILYPLILKEVRQFERYGASITGTSITVEREDN